MDWFSFFIGCSIGWIAGVTACLSDYYFKWGFFKDRK